MRRKHFLGLLGRAVMSLSDGGIDYGHAALSLIGVASLFDVKISHHFCGAPSF